LTEIREGLGFGSLLLLLLPGTVGRPVMMMMVMVMMMVMIMMMMMMMMMMMISVREM
jgi:hypothetical protein